MRSSSPEEDGAGSGFDLSQCRVGGGGQVRSPDGAERNPGFSQPAKMSRIALRSIRATARRLDLPLDHLQLEFGDGLRRVEALRAGLGAVHDRVAAVEPKRVFEVVEPFAG